MSQHVEFAVRRFLETRSKDLEYQRRVEDCVELGTQSINDIEIGGLALRIVRLCGQIANDVGGLQ
jgi:hypothetical protein